MNPRPEKPPPTAAARDERASDELLGVVYDELVLLAQRRMAREPAGQTLQATALVHEAWLRLAGPRSDGEPFANRAHFFAAAATAMRRILVERARAKRGPRRGGDRGRVELRESAMVGGEGDGLDHAALDAALARLEESDPRKGRIVLLRYYAGLTIDETAQALGISPATVKSEWSFARAWLHRELSDD